MTLTRIGLPMVLFSGIIGSLTGFLHSEQRYKSTAAIGFPFNFVYIFFLVFLSSTFGIKGLMVAAVLAVMSQLFIQVPEAKKLDLDINLYLILRINILERCSI